MRKKKSAQSEFDFKENQAIASLSEQEQSIASKIREIRRVAEEEPKKIEAEQQKLLDKLRTIAPPDEIFDQRRAKRFEYQLSRGELYNEYRYQASNLLLFLLLLAVIAGIGYWIIKMFQL